MYFNQISGKHTIEIEYSQQTTATLSGMCQQQFKSVATTANNNQRLVQSAIGLRNDQRELVAETSIPAGNHTSMELEVSAHGGVTPIGCLPLTPHQNQQSLYIVRVGPVPLDIRPLSDYQQSLIDSILSLKSSGWTDSQIANHFNLTGLLTPRGHQFIPQSIFSIRKKYAIRLQRLSGK